MGVGVRIGAGGSRVEGLTGAMGESVRACGQFKWSRGEEREWGDGGGVGE